MDQGTPSSPRPAKPGLDPRNALDILDIRTARQMQTGASHADLASRADAGADMLHYLATHAGAATRAAVAANPAAAAVTNRLLADDEAEDVRAELAVKIARLMPGLSERESSHVFALTIETLECLARDAAVRVRAILAEEIKALDCVPRDIILALARDLHAVVAGPILQYSPLLSDADLIEIIACGQVQEVLTAIARRKPVSSPVADRLVQSLDVPAVAALLVNPDAKIRKETMDRIVEQAEEIQAWHMPLALRADLSARAIRRMGSLVGAGIIERLAARNDLSDTTRIHLNRELRARLAQPDNSMPGAPAPAEAVALAVKENRLDGLFVEQAAQAGSRETVVLALAQLANVTEQTVKKILTAGNAKPIVALVWHAHLSMRVAFKIQTFLMKLPSRDVLPARGGIGFPLSKEEMRWHLTYFNIPV
ncbi:MAG TPA: DUF2336 domain-containing protein [Rhizomicrobium sp.]|jgi:uncharacterized protein (DUF2336 family)|nr:DUF2336 domain-containing protein [Rhizomicrobium sp.]HWA70048.1 DUF2336 domain-containing protein [Rhizomicrobium sp.]